MAAGLFETNVTNSPTVSDKREQTLARIPSVVRTRLIEGVVSGVVLWCILSLFKLLPGLTADTWGVLLFALVGGVAAITRLRRALLGAVCAAAFVVVFVTQTRLSNVLASRWVREDPAPKTPLAAVVVLSAGVNPNGTLNSEALDHLIAGLELVRAGKAPVIVTTTVEQQFPRGTVSSETDQSRIVSLFGSTNEWMRTRQGTSTRDEAVQSAALLFPRGVRRIFVVASPMHTRRACAAFEAVSFQVTCVAALVRAPGGRDPGPWPADRIAAFGDWVYEVAAYSRYRMAGWVGSAPETIAVGAPLGA